MKEIIITGIITIIAIKGIKGILSAVNTIYTGKLPKNPLAIKYPTLEEKEEKNGLF